MLSTISIAPKSIARPVFMAIKKEESPKTKEELRQDFIKSNREKELAQTKLWNSFLSMIMSPFLPLMYHLLLDDGGQKREKPENTTDDEKRTAALQTSEMILGIAGATFALMSVLSIPSYLEKPVDTLTEQTTLATELAAGVVGVGSSVDCLKKMKKAEKAEKELLG